VGRRRLWNSRDNLHAKIPASGTQAAGDEDVLCEFLAFRKLFSFQRITQQFVNELFYNFCSLMRHGADCDCYIECRDEFHFSDGICSRNLLKNCPCTQPVWPPAQRAHLKENQPFSDLAPEEILQTTCETDSKVRTFFKPETKQGNHSWRRYLNAAPMLWLARALC
jgi:hypothetical protein